MPLSWSDIDSLFPSARAAGATAPLLSPEEEESILRRALQTTGSALGAVGNFIDVPGSMVRDVLTWQNPFDQLLTPFSSQNRATGRDILTQFGYPENDPTRWELGDFLGFFAELGTDPLTASTFGASALSKAGKAAKKAGLLDDLAADVSKRLGRKVGKREARAATTLNDLLGSLSGDAADAARQNLRTANKGADLTPELLNTPLGGTANFFGNTLGTGDFAQNYLLRPMDRIGAGIAASGPGRMVRGLFDPSVAGNMSLPLQQRMPAVMRAKQAAEQGRIRETLETTNILKEYLPVDPNDATKPNYTSPEVNAAYKTAQQYLEGPSGQRSDDEVLKILADQKLPELPKEVLGRIRLENNLEEAAYQQLWDDGVAPERFVSSFNESVKYIPRSFVPVANVGKSNAFRSAKQLPLASRHNMHRDPALDWLGGDRVIDELSKDMAVSGPSSELKDQAQRVDHILKRTQELTGGEIDAQAVKQVFADYKAGKHRDIEWTPRGDAEKSLFELAKERELDPAAVRNVVMDYLDGQAAGDLWDMETYQQVVRGRMSPGWWKKFYEVAARGGDQTEVPGFDSLAKSFQSEGLIPSTVDDAGQAAWDMLVERGSPTQYKAQKMADLFDDRKFAAIIDDRLDVIDSEAKRLEAIRAPIRQYEQAGKLADKLGSLPDEYSQYGVGLFESYQPEVNAAYRATAKVLSANARAIQESFADVLKPTASEGDVLVGDAVNMLGIKEGELTDNFLKRIGEYASQRGNTGDVASLYLPRDVVADAMKTMQRLQVPESVGAFLGLWDKANSLTKDLLTLSPGFLVRNYTGGQVQNWLTGVFDKGRHRYLTAGQRLMANQPIKNIEKRIPALKGKTNEEANQWLREQLAILGTVQADEALSAASTVGATGGLGFAAKGAAKPSLTLEPGAVVRDSTTGEVGRVAKIDGDSVTMRAHSRKTGKFYTKTNDRTRLEVLGQRPTSAVEAFGAETPLGRFQQELGTIQTGGLRDILGQAASQAREGGLNPVSRQFWDKWSPLNLSNVTRDKTTFIPSAARSAINTYSEAAVRVPAFLSFLEEGYTPEMAAKMVADMHVDYSALSPFEKTVMRRVVPFYSFNRRMAEYVAKNLMEQPGGRMGQSIRAVNNARSEDNSYIPPYVAEGTAIPLSPDRFISGFGLMHEAPFDMLAVGPNSWKTGQRSLEKALGMTHPLIRGPLEFATGRNFFTGRDQRDLYQFPFSPEGMLGSNARYVNMLLGNSPVARQLSMARTAIDERKEPWWRAVNLLSGFSVTDLSGGADRAREFAGRKAIDELLRESPLAKEFTNIYIPKDKQNLLTRSDAELLALKRTLEKRSREVAKQKQESGLPAGR